MMEVCCLQDNVKNLTKYKRYSVIKNGKYIPKNKCINYNWYFIINDIGQEEWYEYCPMGIIQIIAYTGEVIQYVGKSTDLTTGKYYETFDKLSNEYFYLINDNSVFSGISKRNYLGGAYNFIETTKERDRKINQIITEE